MRKVNIVVPVILGERTAANVRHPLVSQASFGRPQIQHRLSGISSLGGVGISVIALLNGGGPDLPLLYDAQIDWAVVQ